MTESSIKTRPVLCVAIHPKSAEDRSRLQQALRSLMKEDPTLRISPESPESTDGQTVISGMGELHLQIVCDRILREHKIEIEMSEPKVMYLETIHKARRRRASTYNR